MLFPVSGEHGMNNYQKFLSWDSVELKRGAASQICLLLPGKVDSDETQIGLMMSDPDVISSN